MSALSALLAFLGGRREAAPPPLAPPPALPGIPVAAIGDPPPAAPAAAPPLVSAALLEQLGAGEPAAWAPILSAACLAAEITTPARLAAFLATVLVETGGLRRMVESLDYSATGLAAAWPQRFGIAGGLRPNARALQLGRWRDSLGHVSPANQQGIAEAVYAGRLGNVEPGDAWRFRGRGLVQLTGRENWQRLALATGRSLVELEEWLTTREGAAAAAAAYWRWRGCNALADAGQLRELRRAINGGEIGGADFLRLEAAARGALLSGGAVPC